MGYLDNDEAVSRSRDGNVSSILCYSLPFYRSRLRRRALEKGSSRIAVPARRMYSSAMLATSRRFGALAARLFVTKVLGLRDGRSVTI